MGNRYILKQLWCRMQPAVVQSILCPKRTALTAATAHCSYSALGAHARSYLHEFKGREEQHGEPFHSSCEFSQVNLRIVVSVQLFYTLHNFFVVATRRSTIDVSVCIVHDGHDGKQCRIVSYGV